MEGRKRKYLSQPTTSTNNSFKRLKINAESGRAGRIMRIYLRNFMCHTSLEIKFDLNTNYIIGRNGSGKSAILTALIVGLGGRANITNRGTSVKSFIKIGQPSALVEITLSNSGPMAYNPQIFGNEITIVRTFSDSGSNGYKLKSASGEIISTAFRDISKLTEYLNIHVDNPVCVLNQDVARTFLNVNDWKKMYSMFMKATNLENIKLQYKLALRNKNETIAVLKIKLKSLEKLETEVQKWLRKFNAFEMLSKTELKLSTLESEAVWGEIDVIEHELKEKQQIVQDTVNEVQRYSELNQNKNERKNQLQQNIDQIKQKLIDIRNEEQQNQETMNLKRTNLHQLREVYVAKKNDVITIKNVIQRKQIDQKNIEDEISNLSSYQTNRLRTIQERDAKIAELKRKLLDMSRLMETTENDLKQTKYALVKKREEENDIKNELNELSGSIKQKQARIRSMRVDENSGVSIYGNHMQKILQDINAHKEQFKRLPKGPIGSYIKLKDKKWALAVEDFMSQGMLMSFCVDNYEDGKILTRIFNNIGMKNKPTIISSKFYQQVHNYSSNKVETVADCIAVIDALIIEDPVIINCLIDQLAIETILLMNTNELARHLMSNKVHVPRNCSRAITLNGDQFYPDPDYRSYSCRNKMARFLQVSTTEAIRFHEEELQTSQNRLDIITKQTRAVTMDVQKLSDELTNLQNKMSKLDTVHNRIQREINDAELQQPPPEPNLNILTEELSEIKKVKSSKESDLEKVTIEMKDTEKRISEIETEFNELKKISKSLETRMKPLFDEVSEIETKLKEININAKFHAEKIDQYRKKEEAAKLECKRKEELFQEKLQTAEQLGGRIVTERPLQIVLNEIEETKQQLFDIQSSMGDRSQISETYHRLQMFYNKTKSDVNAVNECLETMKIAVDGRARHYNKLTEYIGIRVKEMFKGVLKLRQFNGAMNINHDEQTLELVVMPHHGLSQGSTTHSHILSGGERSYSTVAFLHALWQVMEYPFYFLDEFDVFMDKVNRRTVMDILLEHAKEHPDLQFVFLTPQDISSVVTDNNITVYRMPDPRANSN